MKNRISSILDIRNKKTGFIIVCVALIVTIGTGFAFAANANSDAEKDNSSKSNTVTLFEPLASSEQQEKRFEIYKSYGLTYDRTTDSLYYNGEPVRYFEDYYPVVEGGSAGVDYFNVNGTIDVRAIRDLSQIKQNPDGSTDPSGKLLGLEPFSQAEFDARDIDILLNPPVSYVTIESNGTNHTEPQGQSMGNTAEFTGAASEQNTEGSSAGAVSVYSGPELTPDEYAEMYSIYEPFGVTYDKEQNCFFYNGKLVRFFVDVFYSNGGNLTGGAFSGSMRQMNNENGEIDIHTVRDYTQLDADGYGKLIGIEAD